MTTDKNGRFQPGRQVAVGHSSGSQKLRAAMLNAITETDLQVIITKLIDLARDGDLKATTLLFSVVGKPVDAPPADTSDTAELQPTRNPVTSDRIREIAARVRAERSG